MNYFISVSGGLDSTALAILLSGDSKWGYIFADTGDEFPQVYEHLDKMESVLGIKIVRVKNKKYTLGSYQLEKLVFPSFKMRYCTYNFKIDPIRKYLKQFKPYQIAIGVRSDEDRKGSLDDTAVYPLKEYGIRKCDVVTLCQSKGLIPEYPWYMSRGGCYSCFFKSKNELLGLAKYEPELFDNLIEREEKVNKDGRRRWKKYYRMFTQFELPLRRVKEIANAELQLEMFEKGGTYEADCGVFCRK